MLKDCKFLEESLVRLDGGAIECNRSNVDIVNDAINFTRDWLVIT